MKKLLIILVMPIMFMSCDAKTMQSAMDILNTTAALTNSDIAKGLKEALNLGVGNSVNFLSAKDGFYKSIYKVVLPDDLAKVTDKLAIIPGFDKFEDIAVEKINRAAEDAASKAGPIFVDAIKSITFDDAMNILMGEKNAATTFLHGKTNTALYNEFKPVIVNSLNKFGALDYLATGINKYNSIPLLDDVNPDITDHVTNKALHSMFELVAKKELGIRTDISQRSSDLLKRVFEKQD